MNNFTQTIFANNYININNPISPMLLAYNGAYLSDEQAESLYRNVIFIFKNRKLKKFCLSVPLNTLWLLNAGQ